MKLLAGVLVAITLSAAGTDDDVLERVHVRVIGSELRTASCRDIGAGSGELGYTNFRFQYQISGGRRGTSGHYAGKVTFSLGDVTITTPSSIVWPAMTEKDHDRTEALRRAIFHHEVGHVRIAEAVRDQLNAREPLAAPDPFAFGSAADAIGREGFEKFRAEEREYDALTDHGRKQRAATGVLAGPDTILVCR
ncbi:MAG: hypothetical protein JWM87_150 [Candidatus Eremiobacteraeota bacterium]|nr:hypothetical protein [Candidatus Eremiobacteraeota bacterium]